MSSKRLTMAFVVMAVGLAGCVLISTGHWIPEDRLGKFVMNQTTQSEVEAALGKPENVVFKSVEKVTVYVYQKVVTTQVGIPFPLSFGRSKQTGFSLNVVFKDGIFRGYELVEMKQELWR